MSKRPFPAWLSVLLAHVEFRVANSLCRVILQQHKANDSLLCVSFFYTSFYVIDVEIQIHDYSIHGFTIFTASRIQWFAIMRSLSRNINVHVQVHS